MQGGVASRGPEPGSSYSAPLARAAPVPVHLTREDGRCVQEGQRNPGSGAGAAGNKGEYESACTLTHPG